MLILSRKPGESIVIDGRVIVKVVRVEGDCIKLGIEAPATISVHRQEVYDDIQRNNREALTSQRPKVPRLTSTPSANPNPTTSNLPPTLSDPKSKVTKPKPIQ